MVPIWMDSPLSRAPCSLASSLNHSWCRSLASTLKSEFRRSVVPVVMHCGRGRVLWRCARARSRDRWRRRVELLGCMAGCSVTCACCLLTGLPVFPSFTRSAAVCSAVSCCCARHDHFYQQTAHCHRYVVLGLVCMDQFRSTFHLNSRALRRWMLYPRLRYAPRWCRALHGAVVCSMLTSGPPALCRCGPLCFACS